MDPRPRRPMAKKARGTPSCGSGREARRVADRVQHFPESVIREMTRVAAKHGAINLSQGFPDFDPPKEIVEAAREALRGPYQQYAITWGAKPLRDAIAAKAKRFNGIDADPEANIVVTCGATEAMMAAMLSVVDPGDEVVIPEPFYENYGPDAIVSGARAKFVRMAWPTWELDEEALKGAFTARTIADAMKRVHDFLTVGAPHPLQVAGAVALGFPDTYYRDLAAMYVRKRDLLLGALTDVGFKAVRPDGAYYIMADHTPFGFTDDRSFTNHLVEDIGVAVVPGSSFFSDPEDGKAYVRFMFSKRDETLQEAATRLRKLEPT